METKLHTVEVRQKNIQKGVIPETLFQYCDAPEKNGLSELMALVLETLKRYCGQNCNKFNQKLQMISSAYTPADAAPASCAQTHRGSVFLNKIENRELHCVIASPFFYGKSGKRFDIIMIEYKVYLSETISDGLFLVLFG